jgi:DNA-binding NarL/FixJ family response regulator
MEPIRILVADDNSSFRMGLQAMLRSVPEMEVVGEATTGDDAVALAERLQPDVILMDLQMPGRNGIDATARVFQTSPHIGILVLTMFEDDDSVFDAMCAGARGYVVKGAHRAEILRAIQGVSGGEAIFSPVIARRLMQYFSTSRSGAQAAVALPELTDREREILQLIADYQPNAQIARRLGLREKTVRNHVSNIFSKLQVVDRGQAILRAREAGLGTEITGGAGHDVAGRNEGPS